ncbi:MAG: aldo/keto reductase [Gemmatimonadaceae bacterium]|nr:aldo/keto reductase [Gemmatimonadaceae bacterium]
MRAFADAGITAFDCADIYTGVEARIGAFLRDWTATPGAARIRVHTKCVPDLAALPTLRDADIDAIVHRSRARLGVERLDLVQFHWWDYRIAGWLDAAARLGRLRDEGAIECVGVTNLDVPRLRAIVDAGVPVVAHQLQYSLLDRRPTHGMADVCRGYGITLLCYGALAGGFLHERWLGVADPAAAGLAALENRSLVKYRLIIDEFGGWDAFQALLATMRAIALRHGATIGAVAIRWVLDQPGVGAAIVGARHAGHLPATLAAVALRLDDTDRAQLAAAVAHAPGPAGDCYDLERVPGGRHAVIMKTNLNDDRGVHR